MKADPKHVAVEDLSVLDQLTELAWSQVRSDMGPRIAILLGHKDLDETRELSDAELSQILVFAHLGHTYMCRQKMLGGDE